MTCWTKIENAVDDAANDALSKWASGEPVGPRLPKNLWKHIDAWRFGEYGWMSPVNLMITACWTKWLFPTQDVCRIWARSGGNEEIPGSYSIRRYDERITVPLVAKLDIVNQFCSGNSGMQGTRAVEKTRSARRIERNMRLEQQVRFDLLLFAEIMNDINDLSAEQARLAFQHFIQIGAKIAGDREKGLLALGEKKGKYGENYEPLILRALAEIKDPQFVKVVAAACLQVLAKSSVLLAGAELVGVEGKKTSANARSNEPGDLWLEINKTPVLACEVKDSTRKFGHEILSAVENRYRKNTTLQNYVMVTAADVAVEDGVLASKEWREKISRLKACGLSVQALTFQQLLGFLVIFAPIDAAYINLINEYLVKSPDLKSGIVEQWTSIIE
jgi:hypothetical protein